jgi:hypothetical protein
MCPNGRVRGHSGEHPLRYVRLCVERFCETQNHGTRQNTYLNGGYVMEEQYMRTRLSIRNPFAIASGRRRGSMERAKGNWAIIGSYHCSVNDAILANTCWHTLEQKGMNCRRERRIIVPLKTSRRLTLPLSSISAMASVGKPRRSARSLLSLIKCRKTEPSSSPFVVLIVPNLSDDSFKKWLKVDRLKDRTQGVLIKGQKERK